MTSKLLIKNLKLENGLRLEFFDKSTKLAADRWQVVMLARIEVMVEDVDLTDHLTGKPSRDAIVEMIGNKAVFEKRVERNFVDKKEKDNILRGMVAAFIDSSKPYLSLPDFPIRCIMKSYRETKNAHKTIHV